MDPNTAAAWRDLYIGLVGAGASLTGLTFVAIALDPHQIERTPLLRLRAANAVWCFVSMMLIGLAVLTPRPFAAVAAAAVGVGGLAGYAIANRFHHRDTEAQRKSGSRGDRGHGYTPDPMIDLHWIPLCLCDSVVSIDPWHQRVASAAFLARVR